MKKIEILIVIGVLLPAAVVAQQVKGKSKTYPGENTAQRPQIMLLSQMDQRKIYHWDNGQRATPTGREAGEASITYVKVMGDSAVVIDAPNEETKENPSYRNDSVKKR